MALASTITKSGKDVEVSLSGDIDEASRLPDITDVPEGDLLINLEGVRSINSVGCRQWGIWIGQKAKAKGGIFLVKSSPAIIGQINILYGFLPPHVKIKSFFIPYYCESCHNTKAELTTFGVDYDEKRPLVLKEHIPCPKCKTEMVLDIIKERYFGFLPAGLA